MSAFDRAQRQIRRIKNKEIHVVKKTYGNEVYVHREYMKYLQELERQALLERIPEE